MTADPLAYLHATLDAAEAAAEAARDEAGGADWYAGDESLHSRARGQTIVLGPYGHLDSALGAHFVRHDPAAVLRQIAADRKIMEDCEGAIEIALTPGHDWSPWSRLAYRTACSLAEGWGWTGETT